MVSIIVPVYNVQEFVIDCLESIKGQTFMDFEVIVVEDCSTDESRKLVANYCSGHDGFRMIPLKKNGGLMHAWMTGVENARGNWIFFVDSDDTIPQNALQILTDGLAEHQEVDMVCGNHQYDSRRYGGGLSEHKNPIPEGLYAGEKIHEFQRSIFPTVAGHYFSPSRCAKLIKKSLLVGNLKYCDTSISSGEDVNIMVPIALSCKSVLYIDLPVYYYLIRPTSISRIYKPDTLGMYDRLIAALCLAMQDKDLWMEDVVADLFVAYGFSWARYVEMSNLKVKEKKSQFALLYDDNKQYRVSLNVVTRKYGISSLAYKYALKYKIPDVYFLFERIHKLVRKFL